MKAGKVFYAVLNMGLGHAARSLPIIKAFQKRGWEVIVGSNGRALEFLKIELPDTIFEETPGYDIQYAKNGNLAPKLAAQFPKLLKKIHEEQVFCDRAVKKYTPDLVMSDHCYGIYHQRVLSYFLSHQIHFEMPAGLELLAPLVSKFNLKYHRRFSRVIIPDFPSEDGGLLGGRLSRVSPIKNKYFFSGFLSSVSVLPVEKKIDLLVSISGPEPQRSIFEDIVLQQIEAVPGKKIVVLGKSESTDVQKVTKDLVIYAHVPRKKMSELLNRADLVVSRPGYSTLMELAELGKKALLVPTPGQTEQNYLADRVMKKCWYYTVKQTDLKLAADIPKALQYAGLFKPEVTRWSVQNIFDNLIQPNFQLNLKN